MEIYGIFYGILWKNPSFSINFYRFPQNFELTFYVDGKTWKFSIDIYENLWNSMEFPCKFVEFYGIPQKSAKIYGIL
jgi:hypothetical protein